LQALCEKTDFVKYFSKGMLVVDLALCQGITGSVVKSKNRVINPIRLHRWLNSPRRDGEFALLSPEGRSPIAIGFEWASRIMVAGATSALPAFAGHWVDTRAGSNPIGLLVGMIFGFVLGMSQLLRVVRDLSKS